VSEDFSVNNLHVLLASAFNVTERSATGWRYVFTTGPYAGYVLALEGDGLIGTGDVPSLGVVTGITLTHHDEIVASVSGISLSAADLAAAFHDARHGIDDFTGGGGDDVHHGGNGNDHLSGGDGRDHLDGGRGHDVVEGNGDNDTLNGGLGNDRLNGGSGDDRLIGGGGNDVLAGGDGEDTADYSAAQLTVFVNLASHQAHSKGLGHDVLRFVEDVVGSHHGDTLLGDDHDNVLAGGGGNDIILGRAGNDELGGGAGRDLLLGGKGNDILTGGAGKDLLAGGQGDDTFVYAAISDSRAGVSRDVIVEFRQGHDHIDLSALDANGDADGMGAFQLIDGAFSGAAGELRVELIDRAGHGHDRTIVSADTNGDGHADFQIELKGLVHLTLADFILAQGDGGIY
jgi:Ca2+-binding RTX toxin-like protein